MTIHPGCIPLLTCIMTILSLMSAITSAADMPFIEVDPGRTTAFRTRGEHKPFVMVGLNYFDHETGWAPKHWHKFDEQRVRSQLRLVRDLGLNTIRVFLTQDSFHREPGKVNPEGEAKFRRLIDLCREMGLYLMPSGPDHWEGVPEWRKSDVFADERILEADERWWAEFTGRFKDEPVIIAWDLLNEPMIAWDTPHMKSKWDKWVLSEYGTIEAACGAWGRKPEEVLQDGSVQVPPATPALNDQRLYDYQRFREHIGDEWTRRLTNAIRSADPNHMITIGHVQWQIPIYLPEPRHYAGFEPKLNARHLDFTTVHFYPLCPPAAHAGEEGMANNAAYFETLLYLATTDKPLVLGEFAWYGGGELRVGDQVHLPDRPLSHQVEWCTALLDISRGRIAGWLHWAMADTPTSTDLTRWSGIWSERMQLKPWGNVYHAFAKELTAKPDEPRPFPDRLTSFDFDRKAMLTSPEAAAQLRKALLDARTHDE